jgi:hypothetical protein
MKNHNTKFVVLLSILCLFSVLAISKISIFAESVDLTVTVGNNAPTFTLNPYETTASSGTSPTNIGTNVVIRATGTDANSNPYYLLVCKNGSAPTPGNLSAPECNGGSTNRLCVSTSQTSGVAQICTISTSSETLESVDWYAFVCDHSSISACSSASQGTGDSGSPYYINHAPTFSTAISRPSIAPGGTATFTVPSNVWGDGDSNPSQDTGKLLVCASSGITAGACTGTQLCASSPTLPGNPITCSYTDTVNPRAAGVYDAYTYIVDNHNFPAIEPGQGVNVGYQVTNVAPVVSNIIINNGSNITLSPDSTVPITISALITDSNSCQNLATNPVSLTFYRSSIGNSGCNTTDSSCVVLVSTECTVATETPNTCTGATDSDVKYSCEMDLQYYMDPTDGNVSTNPFYADDWKSTVTAVDQAAASGSAESTTPSIEINSMNAIQMTSAIDYGNLAPNVASGGGLINIPVTVTNVGNVGLDLEAMGNGTGLECSSGACTGEVIPHAQQKWEFANNTTAYASGTNTLTTSLVDIAIDINKPNSTTHPTEKSLYWGLLIPLNQAYGAYTGSNTINSALSAPGNW